jgi:hypothetical protein
MITDRMLTLATLLPILPTMDVPIERMRMSPANIRWLLRNLRVRNNEHPDTDLAIQLLKDLNKHENS